nr:hypothetical protein CTI12_AA123990 [Tanacetum cinerariifolium]
GIDFESKDIENFLNDDSIPFRVEYSYFNMEEDILFLESLLREDPIPPHPINPNQTKLPIEEPNNSFTMGYEHINTNLVTKDVAESSTKNLIPIPNECMVVLENGSQFTEPVKDNSSIFMTISNPLLDNDKINSDEINSHVEFSSNESTSNHDTMKSDYLDEFYGPFIHIHILEEERIRIEHADYINRMEMLSTINPRPHNPTNDNTNVKSFSSFPIPIQESDPHQEEIDVVSVTNDVLPPSDDDSNEDIDPVGDLRVDNFIQNSEHEYSESEDFDFDNPPIPLPPPELPDKGFDFEIKILVVRSVIVKFECINARVKFDVFNDENDVLSYFMFVIFAKEFSLLSAESEDTIFDSERIKKLHDSKIKNRIFNVVDQVLLINSRLKIFSGKLKTRWSGPFTITRVFPYGTIELSQPDGPNFKVNGHRVKHYFGGDIPSNVTLDLHTENEGWDFPSCGGEKCKKGVVCKEGSFWCQACDRDVEYPVLRFKLELDVSDKTTSTVVVMFDEPATELAKCSAYSLAAADEDMGLAYADDMGIASEEVVEEDARSSNVNTSPEINIKLSKQLAAKPTVSTPSKPKEERGKSVDSLNMDTPIPSLSNILHKSFNICSRTIVTRYGKVQSYCGLKLTNIDTQALGKPPLPNNTNACGKQKGMAFTSRHPVNTAEFSRSERPQTCASTRLPKRATLTFVDGQRVNETIVAGLITMLDKTSAVAQAFRMARDWCHSCESVNFEPCLLNECTSARKYNAPTVSEIAALITNDFGDGLPSRDIVVDSKDRGPIRISELHPSYMALQYPLLFSYGEDGFYEKIPYDTNKGTRKTNRGYVSMKQYYAYVIQQRNHQGNTLLRGGRLFQQYLVDAYTAVEEQRHQWTRNNQDTLQVDLYHNLNDAFTRGDTNTEGLGKRIVLPRIFTGGPRYMMQNYQDAVALCRAY